MSMNISHELGTPISPLNDEGIMYIFHELATPRNPLNDERIWQVKQGARLGKTAVELFGDQSDAAAMSSAIHRLSTVLQLSPDGLTGLAAGVRAGRLEQDISTRGSEGFLITDYQELQQVDSAWKTGVRVARANQRAGFEPVFAAALTLSMQGELPFYQAADFLG